MVLFAVSLLLLSTSSMLEQVVPDGVPDAAKEYVKMLRLTCPDDPQSCTQKFQLQSLDDLARAETGQPWPAFVLTYGEFRETPFQDLMRVARFNYYACPITIDGVFKGVVRVCADPEEPGETWISCGSRGPTRVAEMNTYNLTLAPESDSLRVICVLTVQNNSRYIVTVKGSDYYAIPASDMACELMQVNILHVSKMTMFPLAEVLYKVDQSIRQRDKFKR
jgi:hypothetical protein